ncbi:MAG: hypothetical protein HYV95_14605 [Opitutae bacterium]|nr:hypothetical protein [Opitutae bacterium]
MPDSPSPSLHGIRMRVITTAANGVVGPDTIFVFQQQDSLVTSSYAGGRIAAGFLAGRREADRLSFRYVQATTDGIVQSGSSLATLTRSPEGRWRLEERFQWESQAGEGINIFEEI